ncbi:translation initiation factor IF-2 [Trifolium repens]|nr:translation initiation factor IF-2 [Trifolium repens]
MAWLELGKEIYMNFTRALATTSRRHVVGSNFTSIFAEQSVYASARRTPDFINRSYLGAAGFCSGTKECGIRCFHASSQVWARSDAAYGLKTPKKEKYVRRDSRNQPPVEAPYVPRNVAATKSNPDKTIEIFEGMTLVELAKRTGKSLSSLQDILTNVGEKIESEFDPLSMDIAELAAMEVGVNVKRLHSTEGSEILPRPAVVTVMGHVDHGKTSLLDALRQTSVAAREAGGITQHLGAFVVGMSSGASITFLDTPGHAAFSAMRARGAAVTDIVVLVVAADDGVMPQTLEAVSHAKSANVPIVVAINKCDKPGANPEKVKLQLASEGLLLEEMGGDIQVVEVSAIKKIGLDNLEVALLLQADMMDLKARFDGPAQAYVVEARLDKGRGPLVTTIVKAGTLVCGQHVVVGSQWGRIRAIKDAAGRSTQRATPAMPVEIEGLRGLPMAGDDVIVVHSEERARMLSSGRKKKSEEDRLRGKMVQNIPTTTDDTEEVPPRVEMPVIVKADVQGTVQAVADALTTLNSPQVSVNIVHVGVGPISQSDVDLAQACGACIVGFNVKSPPISLSQAATRASIKVIVHRVIYHLLEDIANLIIDKAPGTSETQVAGQAEVLNIFEVKGSKSKGPDVKIAGCKVVEGLVNRTATMRLLRSGEVVFEGPCSSLKREKQDVDSVKKGTECGLVISNCHDFQIGDVIQCLEQVVRKPKFIKSESGAVRIEC